MCKLDCPSGTQNCKDVCEEPRCAWECKAPLACPKPACEMKCETPRECDETTYKSLPALKRNEEMVKAFELPVSLLHHSKPTAAGQPRTVLVPVTRAVEVPGSSELKLVKSSVRMPIKQIDDE